MVVWKRIELDRILLPFPFSTAAGILILIIIEIDLFYGNDIRIWISSSSSFSPFKGVEDHIIRIWRYDRNIDR